MTSHPSLRGGGLRAAERRILAAVIEKSPEPLSRENAARAAGVLADNPLLANYLARLQRLQLVALDGGAIEASPELRRFWEGA